MQNLPYLYHSDSHLVICDERMLSVVRLFQLSYHLRLYLLLDPCSGLQ